MADPMSIEPVRDEDGHEIADAFGARSAFWFLLRDERDPKPRGPYESIEQASTAAAHQVKCMKIAEFWELMLDT